MEKLNVDCLLRIFVEFDFGEKVRMERVCKKWMRILRSHYAHSNIRTLNVLDYLKRSDSNYFQQENLNFIPTIVGVLSRCGPHIRDLSFGSSWFRISQPITIAMSEYCKQMTKLDLSCTILSADLSNVLEKVASNLTYFSIEECNLVAEENVEKIPSYFAKMASLKELNLRKCRVNMSHILDLPSQIERIDISGIHHLSPELITCFLVGHPEIQSLMLNPLPGAQFPIPNLEDPTNGLEMVFDCVASMQKLVELNLGHISYDSLTLPLNCLSRLTKLRSLELKECLGMTDSALKDILINAEELEWLAIINCAKICDYTALGYCKNLRRLHVERSYHFCDEDIRQQTKLERLKLKQCYNVTSNVVQSVVVNCPIREIDLSYCGGIDDSVFELLSLGSPKLRKLSLSGCKITSEGILMLCKNGKHLLKTLIELDLSNNKYIDNECIEHLVRTVGKLKRIRAPLTVYLSQTSVQSELQKRGAKRVELVL